MPAAEAAAPKAANRCEYSNVRTFSGASPKTSTNLALSPLRSAFAAGKEFHEPVGKLVILHTNDVHGRAAADLTAGTLGYAAIAQINQDLLEMGASVLLLDAGDASQGVPIVNLSRGRTAMEFMNAADLDKAQGLLEGYQFKAGRKIIDVSTDGSATQLTDILNRINDGGVSISRCTQNQPSLEDAFLTLIGEKGGTKHE